MRRKPTDLTRGTTTPAIPGKTTPANGTEAVTGGESSLPPKRRGGRKPKTPTPPPVGKGFEWSDEAVATLSPIITKIVGNRDDAVHDPDDRRTDDDGTRLALLLAEAGAFLERPLTAEERTRLRTLFRGGASRLRPSEQRQRRQAKASAITVEIVAWKAGLGARAAAAFRKQLVTGKRSALEFFRYR